MRNELRGPNQDKNNWHKYMSQGATTIHKANPNILVFVSGLNYDTDLSFLKTEPLNVSIGNKLVYEVHSYAWSNGSPNSWNEQPVNQKCAKVMNSLNDKAGFLMSGSNPSPLVMSEFGMDMNNTNDKNQRFMSCMLAYLAGVDLDWALWAAQGAYYIRQKDIAMSEPYGIWNTDFKTLRYSEFSQRFQLVQKKLLGMTFFLLKKKLNYRWNSEA
jgi:hypothetical protein